VTPAGRPGFAGRLPTAHALSVKQKTVAKQRIVNTKFWDDSYIVRLSPTAKLIFLYFLTNPLTNISGVYELPLRRVAFDVGLPEGEIQEVVDRLIADGKIIYTDGWVMVVNFIKYQVVSNPKVRQAITIELKKAPRRLLAKLPLDIALLEEIKVEKPRLPEFRTQTAPRTNGLRSIRELLPSMESIARG
jgi:hypothetical protein